MDFVTSTEDVEYVFNEAATLAESDAFTTDVVAKANTIRLGICKYENKSRKINRAYTDLSDYIYIKGYGINIQLNSIQDCFDLFFCKHFLSDSLLSVLLATF